MGLLDVAEGIGGAIVDGASSIAAAPAKAMQFAEGIANKAENFVEDRVGPTGMALLGAASDFVQGPMGLVPAVVESLIGGLSDPVGYVMGFVESAESEGSSALSFAQDVVGKLVQTSLAGVGVLFSGAVSGLKLIGRSIAAGVKLASAGIMEGFLLGLKLARFQAISLLKLEAGMTKILIARRAKAAIAMLHSITARVQNLTMNAAMAMGKLTIGAFNIARKKAKALAKNIHVKATKIVTKILPKVLKTTTKVMIIANKVYARVHKIAAKVRAIFPAPLTGPLNRIEAFTKNLAAKATSLHVGFSMRVMPAILMAYQALEKTMWPLLAEATRISYLVEGRLLAEIYTHGAQDVAKLGLIGAKLEQRINDVNNGLQGGIDAGVSAIDFASLSALGAVSDAGRSAAKDVGDFATSTEASGESLADKADQTVREKTGLAKGSAVETPRSPQGLPKGPGVSSEHPVAEHQTRTQKFVKGVVDPLAMTKHAPVPGDGDLTGPFYPDNWKGEPYKGPEDALAHNSEITVYVNGIKTTYEQHVAAASALAKVKKRPVVGVYNESEGMGWDLLQCATDKVGFNLAMKNAAVRQMVRIVDDHGSALDIVAHSQGSIIVSSALQIAQMGHGKHPAVSLKNIEFTSLGNAIATRPKGLKDFHAYSFDNDMVSGSVGSTGFTPMAMRMANMGAMGMTGKDMLGASGMTLTDTDTTTLHNPRSAYRAHGVLPDKVKDRDGNTVDDAAPSYITSLGQFQKKEEKWRAMRKSHPFLMAGADALNSTVIPVRSATEIIASGVRGAGRKIEPYIEKGYGGAMGGIGNLGSKVESGVSRGYSSADSHLRAFGKGVESRFNKGSMMMDATIASMQPGVTKSMMGMGWGLAKGAFEAASWATGAAYNLGDKAVRGVGSNIADSTRDKFHAADAGMRSVGTGFSMLGGGMNWLYEKAAGGLASVMRSPTGPMPDEDKVAQSLGGMSSPGSPLPGDVSTKLAPFVGMDASFARVHTDPEAGAAANALRAEAFATGRDIYFAPGNYDPSTPKGMSLLAHELTHVVQQSGGGSTSVQHARSVGSTSDLMEAEAQTVATRVLTNLGAPSGVHVDRLYKVYNGTDGIGNEDARRLDRIGDMAMRIVQQLVGEKHGQLEQVNVTVELDLGRMSDSEAAMEWAQAIVAEIGHLPILPSLTAPAPKLIQRSPEERPVKNPLPEDVQRAIEADVEVIAKELQAWVIDRGLIMSIIDKWAQMDKDTAGRYDSPSRHLDYLFTRMLIRTYDKGTVSTIWVNSLDETFRILDGSGDFGARLRGYMRSSKKYSNFSPEKEQEGVASYVARHTLMGALGILKAMGGAIMGLGQAALWAEWKTTKPQRHALVWSLEKASKIFGADLAAQIAFFGSDDPPKADDTVAGNFDETAKIIIGWMGDLPDQERKQLFEEFSFGNKWGAVPANLMMLGAGSGGLTSKGAQYLLKGLMIAQTVKGIDDASKALSNRIAELQKLHPEMGFWQIVTDGEVLKQMTTIVVSAVSLGTNVAEASEKAKGVLKILQNVGFALDWGQLGPIVKKAYDDYHDTSLEEPQRKEKLEQDAVDFVNQVLAAVNSTKTRADEHKKAAAAQAAADKPVPLPVVPVTANEPHPAPASHPVAGDMPQRAAAPESAPGKAPEPRAAALAGAAAAAEAKVQPAAPIEKAAEAKAATVTETAASPTGASAEAKGAAEAAASPIRTVPAPEIPPTGQRAKIEEEHPAKAAESIEPPSEPEAKPKTRQQREEEMKAKHWQIIEDLADAKPRLGEAAEMRKSAEKAAKDAAEAVAKLGSRREGDLEFKSAKEREQAAKQALEEAVKRETEADKAFLEVEKRQIEARNELGVAAPEGMRAVVDGTRSEQMAAAKDLILKSKSWKEGLRELVAGLPDKADRSHAEVLFDRARGEIIAEAHRRVIAGHPELAELKLNTPGTPGFSSDIDAGINPRVTPGKEELAGVVKRSAEMVKLMNDELRAMTGGEPDLTLDTNMYSWTGSEVVRNEVNASKEARTAQDVASIAEMRQKRSAGDWAAMRKEMIAKAQEKGGAAAAAAMEAQLVAGEHVAEGLKSKISKARKNFMKDNRPPEGMSAPEWRKISEMRAREVVASNLRRELGSILEKPQAEWDLKRVTELQTQVAMAEPGAYASRAGVDEIVNFGQPLTSLSGEKAREHYMTAERPMTPRELSNSAASSLAQLEDHAEHRASNRIEAEELLKNAMKYSERIYNEARKAGRDSAQAAGAPELDQFYRKGSGSKGKKGLIEWFAEQQKEPLPSVPTGATAEQKAAYEAAYIEMANRYAEKQVQWARDMVAELKAEAVVSGMNSGDAKE